MTASASADESVSTRLDVEAIRQLRRRYALIIESGYIDGLDRVFTESARVTLSLGTLDGLPAIKWALKEQLRLLGQRRAKAPFMHAIARHDIDLKGGAEAFGRCDFVHLQSEGLRPEMLSVFADRYKRIDGEWRIVRSIIDVASTSMVA